MKHAPTNPTEPKPLTAIHWKVYEAVKASTEYGFAINQRDLCEATGLPYRNETGSHDHCFKLWQIVKDINESLEVDEIISVHNFTYKIAENEEEASEYRNYLMRKFTNLKNRVEVLDAKMARNRQGQIGSEEFHETYPNKGE